MQEVRALRDIPAVEEMTASYLRASKLRTRAERLKDQQTGEAGDSFVIVQYALSLGQIWRRMRKVERLFLNQKKRFQTFLTR